MKKFLDFSGLSSWQLVYVPAGLGVASVLIIAVLKDILDFNIQIMLIGAFGFFVGMMGVPMVLRRDSGTFIKGPLAVIWGCIIIFGGWGLLFLLWFFKNTPR